VEQLYDFELLEIKHETQDITSFKFSPKDKSFSWQAGQYLDWQLPHDNPDDRGQRRWFSIASAPAEGYVMLSCRFSEEGSTLKRHLQTLQVGATVQAKGPLGEFTADSNELPLVLIAGGIGITPFRSILMQRASTGTLGNITLIYGNKTEDNIAFAEELNDLIQNNPGFSCHYVTGQRIDADIITNLVGSLEGKSYMISGLEKMVEAIETSLVERGVPKENIRIDDFGGYDWNVATPVYQ
jgi:ferredoxin-NADP reductase